MPRALTLAMAITRVMATIITAHNRYVSLIRQNTRPYNKICIPPAPVRGLAVESRAPSGPNAASHKPNPMIRLIVLLLRHKLLWGSEQNTDFKDAGNRNLLAPLASIVTSITTCRYYPL